MTWATVSVLTHLLIEALVILRVVLRPHREPASRIAWIAVIAALPVVGVIAYLLLGEVNIGRRRVAVTTQPCWKLGFGFMNSKGGSCTQSH